MKLIFNNISPFARKCRVLISLLGIEKDLSLENIGALSPIAANEKLLAYNPLGKIPILVLGQDQALLDSRVICEYLNTLAGGDFFPSNKEQKFASLQCQSLADGLSEAALSIRYELSFREQHQQSEQWMFKQRERIAQVINHFDRYTLSLRKQPAIGEIAIACALGYIDFRLPDIDWRATNDNLANWFDELNQNDFMRATAPGL